LPLEALGSAGSSSVVFPLKQNITHTLQNISQACRPQDRNTKKKRTLHKQKTESTNKPEEKNAKNIGICLKAYLCTIDRKNLRVIKAQVKKKNIGICLKAYLCIIDRKNLRVIKAQVKKKTLAYA
jgi:hypothetical protein